MANLGEISFSFEVGLTDYEPHPEGNNFSTIERGEYTPVGFHAD